MTENLSLTVPMNACGAGILLAVAAQMSGSTLTAPATPPAAPALNADGTPKQRPGRKPNPEKAAAAAAAQPQAGASAAPGGGDLGLGDDDELGLGDMAPAPAPAPVVKLTLEGDIVPAFKKRIEADKGDKTKAGQVLAGFGVKGVRDLKESDYAACIAKLKV